MTTYTKKGLIPFLALFLGACVFFLCSAFLGDNRPAETDNNFGIRVEHCIEGSFYATSTNLGLGNVVFELLGFIGIAKVTGRLPIITDETCLKRLDQLRDYLPEMHAYAKKMESDKERCIYVTRSLSTTAHCCTYDDSMIEIIKNATEWTVHLSTRYTQGIKYIRNVPETLLQSLFNASDSVRTEVKNLFPADVLESNNQKICVHIRLGDFKKSALVYPSSETFTVASVRHVQNSARGANSEVLVFSNDVNTSSQWFDPFQNVYHAVFDKSRPANTEWEFSRQYCDVVVITASASTYGWWIGYLSKGQKVYFNKDFSRPRGIERELNPTDFFPPAWIPLKLEGDTVKEAPYQLN